MPGKDSKEENKSPTKEAEEVENKKETAKQSEEPAEEKPKTAAEYFARAHGHYEVALKAAGDMKEGLASLKEINEKIVFYFIIMIARAGKKI